jgi:hypothetical protein
MHTILEHITVTLQLQKTLKKRNAEEFLLGTESG